MNVTWLWQQSAPCGGVTGIAEVWSGLAAEKQPQLNVRIPAREGGRRATVSRRREFGFICLSNQPIVAIWAIEDSASYVFSIAALVVP